MVLWNVNRKSLVADRSVLVTMTFDPDLTLNISETTQDRATERKSYVLYRMVIFPMTLPDP